MQDKRKTLNLLGVNDRARILILNNTDSIRRRLQEIGLIPGTEVTCLFVSPQGDPTAYLIRGAVIALREEDSSKIIVTDSPVGRAGSSSMPER